MNQTSSVIVVFAMFGVIFSVLPSAYSQTSDVETSKQITLSGDLLNDPIAQEILQKIEESKQKIAKLEQQSYKNIQAQKFLEERRAVALERLNEDLTLWEEKWYEFSPEVAYQKFAEKKPSEVQGIYLKQFDFTQSKHDLGMNAKTNALDDGLDSPQALDKFNDAAQSTVQEYADYNEKIQPDSPSEISTKIAIIEGQINTKNAAYFYHHLGLKGELNAKYAIQVENERNDLRQISQEYLSGNGMTIEDFTKQSTAIREKYAPIKKNILNENSKALSEFETKHVDYMQYMLEQINDDDSVSSVIQAVWNPDTSSIEIMRK